VSLSKPSPRTTTPQGHVDGVDTRAAGDLVVVPLGSSGGLPGQPAAHHQSCRGGAAGVPLNNRTHRKSLIIDGRIGFTGSAGIADHWTGNAQDDKHRRDLQIRFEGPTVQPLQTGFAPNWLECTGELVTGATARGNINN
jgi:hypothetical protein